MIEPYYKDETTTIYCGDCVDVINQLDPVDIVVTSPPYNQIAKKKASGMHAEHRLKLLDAYDTFDDDMTESEYQEWMRTVFQACQDNAKGLVWVNHKTRFRDRVGIHPLQFLPGTFYSEVIWQRIGAMTFNAKKFAPSHELIYGMGKPHYWNDESNKLLTVWKIPQVSGQASHPCPFPVEIPSRLIVASCPPGGVVLDPFVGSGTTLVAAKKNGRKSIGIDISPKYCDLAIDRLKQNYLF